MCEMEVERRPDSSTAGQAPLDTGNQEKGVGGVRVLRTVGRRPMGIGRGVLDTRKAWLGRHILRRGCPGTLMVALHDSEALIKARPPPQVDWVRHAGRGPVASGLANIGPIMLGMRANQTKTVQM